MGRLLWAGFVVTGLVSVGGLSTSLSAERFTRRTVDRERPRSSMAAVADFADIADAIVEVRLVDQVAFEVTARLCGPLDPGDAIPLTQFGKKPLK